MTYINTLRYKTMIMTFNSKNNFNSRDKMNNLLDNFKIEISKIHKFYILFNKK